VINIENQKHIEYHLSIKNIKEESVNDWRVWKRIKQIHTLQRQLDDIFENSNEMPTSAQVMKQ